MAARTVRATALGTLGTGAMAAMTWWLLRSSLAAWPGSGTVELDSALAFIATGVAGAVAGWATLLLATATASLVTTRPGAAARSRTPFPSTVGRGLSGRIAAGLLVAASVGMAPATAAGAVVPATASLSTAHGAVRESAGPTWTDVTGAVPAQPAEPGQPDAPDQPAAPDNAEAPDQAEDEGGALEDFSAADEIPVPGWTPTVTDTAATRLATGEVSLVSTAATAQTEDEVVVHRGDTLWDIAARHLGEHATDQDVADAWPRWYAANRDVIGGDPDLIHPGQRLVVPAHGGAR